MDIQTFRTKLVSAIDNQIRKGFVLCCGIFGDHRKGCALTALWLEQDYRSPYECPFLSETEQNSFLTGFDDYPKESDTLDDWYNLGIEIAKKYNMPCSEDRNLEE